MPRRRWVGRVAPQVAPPAGRAVRPGSVSSSESTASEPTSRPSSNAQSARSNGKALPERGLVLLRRLLAEGDVRERDDLAEFLFPRGTYLHAVHAALPEEAAARLEVGLPVGLAGLAALAQQLVPLVVHIPLQLLESSCVARLE